MAIVLRTQKGSALTWTELDGNFTELSQSINTVTASWALNAITASYALNAGTIGGAGAQNYLAFFSGSAVAIGSSVVYQNGSNIGIGTVSPSYKLQISADSNSPVFSAYSATNVKWLEVDATGNRGTTAYTAFTVSGSTNLTGSVSISGPITISGSFTVISGSTEFQVLGTGTKIGNAPTDVHTITGSLATSGSLGINTTGSSTYQLDVAGTVGKIRVGNSNFSDIFTLGVGSGGQGYSDVYINGQSYGLALYANPQSTGYSVTGNSAVGSIIYSTASIGLIAGGTSGALVFGTQGTEKMRVHLTGDVSIGTQDDNKTLPGYRLNITGSGISGSLNVNKVLVVSGSSVQVTGSATISDVLVLPFQSPLPSNKPAGSVAISGSGGTFVGMFVYNGTSWVNVKA